MARKGAFKSEKRKKEVIRQKKQEEKRQKRLHKDTAPGAGTEADTGLNPEAGTEPGTEPVAGDVQEQPEP